jgi:hypothetical protein
LCAAFVDVSPEELQQRQLQSSLETVDVKQDISDSEAKEDTEQNVSYVLKFGNSVPTNAAGFTLFYDSQRFPRMELLLSRMKMLLLGRLNPVCI